MFKIKIDGIPGADGVYELDEAYFTNREFHIIKQVSGVRAGELAEALGAGDLDIIVALTLIALKRAGKDVPADALWDADAGKITFEAVEPEPDPEVEKLPPTVASGSQNERDESQAKSGSNSRVGLDTLQESDQSFTGAPV